MNEKGCAYELVREQQADGRVAMRPVYKLTYKKASELLRPQHALVYASIQGRTMKTSVALMDLNTPNMTMRDIITAMSRPTKGIDLHVMTAKELKKLMDDIDEAIEAGTLDLRALVVKKKMQSVTSSERPTPSRVGRA